MFKGIFEKITDQKDPNDYDPEQLKAGTDIELEHTDDRELAQKIAMDHLDEHPDYYIKIKKLGL